MTNKEAIEYLIMPMQTSTTPSVEYQKQKEAYDLAIEALKAQDQTLNEWCTDCKEYDHEKHCCPRFNRVIKSALEDVIDTNVGDMVSRQTVLETVESELIGNLSITEQVIAENIVNNVCAKIRQLPSTEPRTFTVIDTKTGREADTYNIALKEEWAKGLCYCDIDMFVVGEDGTLMLIDDCGKCAYCPEGRFEVKWNE